MCRNGVEIVIFGHSHNIKMDKDSFLVQDRIYANYEYWYGFGYDDNKDDNPQFIETDGQTVQLNYPKNGAVVKKLSLCKD